MAEEKAKSTTGEQVTKWWADHKKTFDFAKEKTVDVSLYEDEHKLESGSVIYWLNKVKAPRVLQMMGRGEQQWFCYRVLLDTFLHKLKKVKTVYKA